MFDTGILANATDTQLMQTEAAYDTAMQRVTAKFGEVTESFKASLWNNIALSVVKTGYASAMDYARNASFNPKV